MILILSLCLSLSLSLSLSLCFWLRPILYWFDRFSNLFFILSWLVSSFTFTDSLSNIRYIIRTMIMINNSVFDEALGAVNGLGQSMASLARAIGPAFGGLLWSISEKVIWSNSIAWNRHVIDFLLHNILPLTTWRILISGEDDTEGIYIYYYSFYI